MAPLEPSVFRKSVLAIVNEFDFTVFYKYDVR